MSSEKLYGVLLTFSGDSKEQIKEKWLQDASFSIGKSKALGGHFSYIFSKDGEDYTKIDNDDIEGLKIMSETLDKTIEKLEEERQ